MAKDRGRKHQKGRKENTREERIILPNRALLNFSFKYLDQTQPATAPETLDLWLRNRLLDRFCNRLIELSKLTRDEAFNQQQIKLYGDFPPANKTCFFHPKHVEEHVAWSVIEGIGGLPRVAGFIAENTFYVVFLDSQHQFWLSTLKHT